jgi:hypothetical protein
MTVATQRFFPGSCAKILRFTDIYHVAKRR